MITIKQLGGRKFVLCFVIITFTFLLILINRLSSADFLKMSMAIIGLYAGLNVYQKTKVKRIDKKE